MTNFAAKNQPITPPPAKSKAEKQADFLNAIHGFCESPDVKRIADNLRDDKVEALIKLSPKVQCENGKFLVRTFDVEAADALFPRFDYEKSTPVHGVTFLKSGERFSEFFREKVGEENLRNEEHIRKAALEHFGRGVWNIRDEFEKLSTKPTLDEALQSRISSALQAIAWRNPQDKKVTAETAADILSNQSLPEFHGMDNHWLTLKTDLATATGQLPDGELKTMLNTIAQAGETSGMFAAAEVLLGEVVAKSTGKRQH